jgi:hypothetical protein
MKVKLLSGLILEWTPNPLPTPPVQEKPAKKRVGARPGVRRNLEALSLALATKSIPEVMREFHFPSRTSLSIYVNLHHDELWAYGMPERCDCGRPFWHKGPCAGAPRQSKPKLPGRATRKPRIPSELP